MKLLKEMRGNKMAKEDGYRYPHCLQHSEGMGGCGLREGLDVQGFGGILDPAQL